MHRSGQNFFLHSNNLDVEKLKWIHIFRLISLLFIKFLPILSYFTASYFLALAPL